MNGSEADDTAVVAKPKGYATDSLGRIVVKSLKELAAVPADSTIYLCDLSGQGLDSIPDLSRRKITNLNLSHNKLAWKFSIKQLPKTLQSLNLSHNMLGTLPKEKKLPEHEERDLQVLVLPEEENRRSKRYVPGFPNLLWLDISHNNLRSFYFSSTLRHIDASHNQLRNVGPTIWWEWYEWRERTNWRDSAENVSYLNLSYNWDMIEAILYPVEKIDTLITEHCAYGRKIHYGDMLRMN